MVEKVSVGVRVLVEEGVVRPRDLLAFLPDFVQGAGFGCGDEPYKRCLGGESIGNAFE
jgi:hypothetical protein